MSDDGGLTYQVGNNVTYYLDVSTSASGGDIAAQTPLTVTDPLPVGLSDLSAFSTDWNTTLDNTTSPATMTATYTGATPIVAGTALATINITGTLTDQAVGTLSNTATLSLPGDSNSTNNTSSVDIQVIPASTPTPQPTVTSSPTPGSTPTSSPTPGSTPTSGSGPDLAITLVDDTTGCSNIGDQINYTATVANGTDAGQVAAGQPIVVTINLPDGLSDVTTDGGTDWQISTNGTTVTANYSGNYPVDLGASLTPVMVTATIQAPLDMSPTSNATVTTSQDMNASNETGSDTLTICPPNLTISTIHQGADTSQVGQPISYTLTASNGTASGPVLAGQAITVTDDIPLSVSQVTAMGTGWQFITTSSSNTTTVTATYTGSYPILTGDALPDITISGVLTAAAIPTVINTTVVSTPLDSDTSDNTSSDTLSVVAAPDLAIGLKPAGTTCVSTQYDAVWTLSVTNGANAGPVLNGSIIVTDIVSDGLSNIRAVGRDWSITASGTTVTATYTGTYPIDPGTTMPPITVRGTVIAADGATLLNTAAVSIAGDSNVNNNTMSDSVSVCQQQAVPPDLGIRFMHAGTKCTNIGDHVIYTATVTNGRGGPVSAGQLITVLVKLPVGLSNVATNGGTDWQIGSNGTVVTANYSGSYPIMSGSTLRPITITATMRTPMSINPISTAMVNTLQNSNRANKTAQDMLIICAPGLVISKTHQGGSRFHVGQQVTYTIAVSNKPGSGPVIAGQTLVVIDTIPRGLKQIKAAGTNWQFTITSLSGATRVIATYRGQYPVVAGEHLPNITISGILTTSSLPVLTNTALMRMSSRSISVTNTSSSTIFVRRVLRRE